jgi:hypothetical protein
MNPMMNTYGNLRQTWFGGTAGFKAGEAFAFKAGSINEVEKLSVANILNFAGVSTSARSASTAGQSITLAMPGNMDVSAIVLGNHDAGAVISALVAPGIGNGYFAFNGKVGAGSVLLNEAATGTKQNGLDNSFAVGTDGKTVTITVDPSVVVGDKMLVIASADEDVVSGEYVVESIAGALTSVVLATSIGNTSAAKVTGVIYAVPPKVRVRVLSGTPTGLVQLTVDGSEGLTAGGKTLFVGGYSPSSDIALAVEKTGDKVYALTSAYTSTTGVAVTLADDMYIQENLCATAKLIAVGSYMATKGLGGLGWSCLGASALTVTDPE